MTDLPISPWIRATISYQIMLFRNGAMSAQRLYMAVYLHKQSISVIQRAMHVKTDVRFDIKLKVKEGDSHKIPKQIQKIHRHPPLRLMAIDCKCQCCGLSFNFRLYSSKINKISSVLYGQEHYQLSISTSKKKVLLSLKKHLKSLCI